MDSKLSEKTTEKTCREKRKEQEVLTTATVALQNDTRVILCMFPPSIFSYYKFYKRTVFTVSLTSNPEPT